MLHVITRRAVSFPATSLLPSRMSRSWTSYLEESPLLLEVFFPTFMPFFSPRSLLPNKFHDCLHWWQELPRKTGFSKILPFNQRHLHLHTQWCFVISCHYHYSSLDIASKDLTFHWCINWWSISFSRWQNTLRRIWFCSSFATQWTLCSSWGKIHDNWCLFTFVVVIYFHESHLDINNIEIIWGHTIVLFFSKLTALQKTWNYWINIPSIVSLAPLFMKMELFRVLGKIWRVYFAIAEKTENQKLVVRKLSSSDQLCIITSCYPFYYQMTPEKHKILKSPNLMKQLNSKPDISRSDTIKFLQNTFNFWFQRTKQIITARVW